MADDGEDTPRSDLPWSFVLDPVANARAIGDVQRRGLHAARVLIDRVVANLDRLDDASGQGTASSGGSTEAADPMIDLVQAWSKVLSRTMGAFGATATDDRSDHAEPSPPHSTSIDLTGHGTGRPIRLDADEKGALRSAPHLELRNPSSEPVGPLQIHLGDLRSPDGELIPSPALHFEPASFEAVPPGEHRTVDLTLTSSTATEPGVYRGLLQIAGAPNVAVPVHLSVGRGPET